LVLDAGKRIAVHIVTVNNPAGKGLQASPKGAIVA
jgi:hypothetical protein